MAKNNSRLVSKWENVNNVRPVATGLLTGAGELSSCGLYTRRTCPIPAILKSEVHTRVLSSLKLVVRMHVRISKWKGTLGFFRMCEHIYINFRSRAGPTFHARDSTEDFEKTLPYLLTIGKSTPGSKKQKQ